MFITQYILATLQIKTLEVNIHSERYSVCTCACHMVDPFVNRKVRKDQEKVQSETEKDFQSKNRERKKNIPTTRLLYHENTLQAEWAAIFQIGGHPVT